ncbi:MAG: HAMP domain-containing histidine kinase [Pirellulales bacterium]|nr:HAMP domain-containing histidine kinase [Pirellulales bacterium]
MPLLPPLLVESVAWRLAVSEHSAAVLAGAMLADDPAAAAGPLAEALAVDPPLAVWAACRARQEGAEPRDAHGLATWLAGRAVERFADADDVAADASGVPPVDLPQQDAHNVQDTDRLSRVEQAVARAELVAALAAEDPDASADEAYLAALVHEPAVWFGPAGAPGAAGVSPMTVSQQLGQDVQGDHARRIAEAVGLLSGQTPDESKRDLIAESRQRGAAAAARWAEPSAGPAISLNKLAARLARLRALETQWHAALEQEKLEAMAEFAAGAGHEINNPLAVIAGRAQLMLQEEADPERRRALALISAQAKRVYEMIADMMLFARPPAPVFEPVDLAALVDRLIERWQPQMAEQAVGLRRVGREGPLTVEADPTQLNVALGAVLRNALEAIGHDGQVDVELDETDLAAIIRVRDNGPGISASARRHLFDPYYSERQAGRGLGLGLSKCWRIVVTNHGGTIDVAGRPGQETVFSITLPKRRDGGLPRRRGDTGK